MITLDQIKQLDFKVRKAIDKINSLTSANDLLQEKLDNYQLRIEELEILIDTFKEDQGEIENGIIDALNQLDIFEENSTDGSSSLNNEPSDQENESEEETSETDYKSEDKPSLETNATTDQSSPDNEPEEDVKEESNNSEIELDIF